MSRTLSRPVKDVYGKIVFDGSKDVLDWANLHNFKRDYLIRKAKFRDMHFFMEDCQSVFDIKPYDKCLEGWTDSFKDWIGEIWAPRAIFDELKQYKEMDPIGYQHILVISVVGARMLEFWIKTSATVKKSFQALLTHQIGKPRFAGEIIQKEGDLNDDERQIIREHPLYSYVLNAAYWGSANHLSAQIALSHHEDRLGEGYPQQIKTNSLMLDILAVLDRYDAMINDRPFRFKRFAPREALDLLKDDADKGKIESDVLRVLVALVRGQKIKNVKRIRLGTPGRPEKAKKES